MRGYMRGSYLFIIVFVLGASSLTGCAGRDFTALRPGMEKRGHYIEGVPFYRQNESTCGPAALAGVLAFWSRPATLEQITAKVYLPELRGTLPMDMETYLRNAGFETESSSGTLEELKGQIRRGVPVICLLDLGFGPYREPHYVTVIGFDDVNSVIIAHDGLKANNVIGYDAFVKEWGRGGNWMLVAKPGQP